MTTTLNADLAATVDRLAGAPVVCVGDVMLDRFIYGDVERVSPEAPIPVLRITREISMLGGAGNVVRNLTAVGAASRHVTITGDDPAGDQVTALLAEERSLGRVLRIDGRRTTIKTRYVCGGQQLLRADREDPAPIDSATVLRVRDAVAEQLGDAGALILSDYGKGLLTPDLIRRLILLGREAGVPVIVDPKGRDYTVYRHATLLTPNRHELAQATGLATGSDIEVAAAARRVLGETEAAMVLATRGPDGMTLVPADGAPVHFPAEAREVFDVSGAGDTVIAVLAAALAGGLDPVTAVRLANVAGGIVVGKVGTAVVHGADLTNALHRSDLDQGNAKVLTLEQAVDQVHVWRQRNLKVGFTNGCFDLLHPGHVSLLSQARAACDRLIVGLNSDASVQRLKGPARPVQTEMARATVLASLADVDRVVIFAEDTPRRLIQALVPDVLVKGADYTVETVVGADIVQAHGGRVVLANLEAGHSTTATVARIAAGGGGDET